VSAVFDAQFSWADCPVCRESVASDLLAEYFETHVIEETTMDSETKQKLIELIEGADGDGLVITEAYQPEKVVAQIAGEIERKKVTLKDVGEFLHPLGHSLTWNDVSDFIHKFEFDKDEYFQYSFSPSRDVPKDDPVWDKGVHWVACYWVIGGSEGYYVHVDQLVTTTGSKQSGNERRMVLLGKFWDIERAQAAANAVQLLVNMA